MADHMNGNEAERIGIQSQRITNLETGFADFRRDVNTQFHSVNSSMSGLSSKLDERFNNLVASLSERGRTPWGVIISAGLFFLAVISAVGGLAYWPILSASSKLEAGQVSIVERMVTQKELEWRTARASEDRQRAEMTFRNIDNAMVPRAELDRVFQGYDQRLSDQQRQIDETKAIIGNTYSLRDYIQRMTERLDQIEQRTLYVAPRSRLTP